MCKRRCIAATAHLGTHAGTAGARLPRGTSQPALGELHASTNARANKCMPLTCNDARSHARMIDHLQGCSLTCALESSTAWHDVRLPCQMAVILNPTLWYVGTCKKVRSVFCKPACHIALDGSLLCVSHSDGSASSWEMPADPGKLRESPCEESVPSADWEQL